MKILIPLDGSSFAEQILEPAARVATRCSAEVQLLSVLHGRDAAFWRRLPTTDEPHNVGSGMALGVTTSPLSGVPAETELQAEERLKQQAEDYLQHLATTHFLGEAGYSVIFGDDPAEEIIKYAREEGFDLIAIATHGHTGLARLVMGSVADRLLKSRVAPLLLIHPEELK